MIVVVIVGVVVHSGHPFSDLTRPRSSSEVRCKSNTVRVAASSDRDEGGAEEAFNPDWLDGAAIS